MSWLNLEDLLLEADASRQVTPEMNHAVLCQRALRLAAHWQAAGVQRVALHLQDAAELAIALLAAWQADIHVPVSYTHLTLPTILLV